MFKQLRIDGKSTPCIIFPEPDELWDWLDKARVLTTEDELLDQLKEQKCSQDLIDFDEEIAVAEKIQTPEQRKSLLEQDQIQEESDLEDFEDVEAEDKKNLAGAVPTFSRQQVIETFLKYTTDEKLARITNDFGKTGLSQYD